jgi:hypothetical protein
MVQALGHDVRNPTVTVLKQIATALGVPAARLLNEVPSPRGKRG